MSPNRDFFYLIMVYLQRGAVGLTQGLVISFAESSIGWRAMLQLLYSQKGNKLQEELLKRNKQNLNVRPTATRCSEKLEGNGPMDERARRAMRNKLAIIYF